MTSQICAALLNFGAVCLAGSPAETPVGKGGQAAQNLPNILWIGVDQMRQDTPGCYGNRVCRTPNIDRLAREGTRFTRAYTTCCLCSPARASMLTGMYAFRHGMGTNCDLYHSLAAELPQPGMLLHHRLAELGYQCGFAGKWHVGATKGATDYGFEGLGLPGYGNITKTAEFRDYLTSRNLVYGPVRRPIFGNPGNKTLLAGIWDGPAESTPSYYLANYTIRLLDRFAESGKPFFMDCQFWGPHSPHLPSQEFAGSHDRGGIEPWPNWNDDLSGKPASVRRFRSDFYRDLPGDWKGWREIIGLYYDYASMIDRQIGRVLNHLDKLGLSDRTIVIFEADHGDMIGSHGLFDKGFMFEEDFRIPMIVRRPGGRGAGQTCDAFVYNMDIFPTILDALGRPDAKLDGQSFLAALEGRPLPNPRRAAYLEFHGIRYLYSQRALVSRDGYKYIFNAGDFDEMYDLNQDPGELHNRIASPEYGEVVARLRQEFKATALRLGDPICDNIAKMFGDWTNLSGQFEASAPPEPAKKR